MSLHYNQWTESARNAEQISFGKYLFRITGVDIVRHIHTTHKAAISLIVGKLILCNTMRNANELPMYAYADLYWNMVNVNHYI